jgi:nitrate/TMAO reductase-like tetraheme cytochrome c subunit
MPDAALDPPASGGPDRPRKRRIRVLVVRGVLVILAAAGCSLLAVEVTEPLAEPSSCAKCHEMSNVYESWKASAHHTNLGGVKVTCIACHLPPREDHLAHLASKACSGAKDVWVHLFGEYDANAARETVLRTLPSQRCLHCHDNLLAISSSSAVGIVHDVSVKRGDGDGRAHACVTCHDALHGPTSRPAAKEYEEADNSFCFVCHVNFKKEEFVSGHQSAGVGCVECHGESLDHADDEDHVTPPEIMFLKGKVNASCTTAKCHPEPRMKAEIGHRPFYAGADAERKYCTDCHGKHRIEKRQRKWDRVSRKLIWRDGYAIEEGGEAAP